MILQLFSSVNALVTGYLDAVPLLNAFHLIGLGLLTKL